MSTDAERALDARYHNLYGRIAGYLPKNREAVDEWQESLKREIEEARAKGKEKPHSPAVADLAKLIETDGIVRMYVDQMIAQQPSQHKTVDSIEDLLACLNHIVTTAPPYNPVPADQNFFPMSSLFTYMMMTPAGEAIFRNTEFNDALRKILKEWCRFLDSDESLYVLTENTDGWLSRSAYFYNKLYEFEIPDRSAPHWGWTSFNAYFHRQIKPESRPVDGPGDPRVVVSANDGTVYRIADKVCVMPIGITEISSVNIQVHEGQTVDKGEELGYFSYGGSGMCLVFQPGAIDRFTVPNRPPSTNPDDGPPIRVNSQIAVARV